MKDNQGTVIRLGNLKGNGDDLRTTPAMADADKELRASIVAHGLLEPLVVRKIKRSPIPGYMPDAPEWHVIAGHRRLRALRALADGGEIAADAPIDCTILDESVDTTEAALAENVVRVAMNRADQVTAFARLVDQGATVEGVAVRFGVTVKTVERQLRLAHLAPRILDGYRSGEITEEVAQAYATTADTERQMEAYEWMSGQYYPPRLPVPGASAAMNGYQEAPKLDLPWFDKSKSAGELFEAYRSLDSETKGRLTAGVVASLLFSMPGGDGTRYDAHAAIESELEPDYAAQLLDVDGDLWGTETMWSRLRKDQIIDECRPSLGDEWATGAAKLKKGELAKDAAERMKAHPTWLPKGFQAATRPERDESESA